MKGGVEASPAYAWLSKHQSVVEDWKYNGKVVGIGADGVIAEGNEASLLNSTRPADIRTRNIITISGGSQLSSNTKCVVCLSSFLAPFNRFGARDGVCPKCQKQIKFQKLQQIMENATSVVQAIKKTAEAFGCSKEKATRKLEVLWKARDCTILIFMSTIIGDVRQSGNVTSYAYGKVGSPKNRLINVWERDQNAIYYACPSCVKIIMIPVWFVDSYGLIADRHCITCSKCPTHTYPHFESWSEVDRKLVKAKPEGVWTR